MQVQASSTRSEIAGSILCIETCDARHFEMANLDKTGEQ